MIRRITSSFSREFNWCIGYSLKVDCDRGGRILQSGFLCVHSTKAHGIACISALGKHEADNEVFAEFHRYWLSHLPQQPLRDDFATEMDFDQAQENYEWWTAPARFLRSEDLPDWSDIQRDDVFRALEERVLSTESMNEKFEKGVFLENAALRDGPRGTKYWAGDCESDTGNDLLLYRDILWGLDREYKDEELADCVLIVNEILHKEKQHLDYLRTGAQPEAFQRERISEEIRMAVWRRDQGRCARCGSRERLEFDHIVPVALGGATTLRNLELLCESCNRRKGASVGQ